jgi:hypothetical protein
VLPPINEPEDLQIPSSSLADCSVFCHPFQQQTNEDWREKQPQTQSNIV